MMYEGRTMTASVQQSQRSGVYSKCRFMCLYMDKVVPTSEHVNTKQ